jgi:fluoride exporter
VLGLIYWFVGVGGVLGSLFRFLLSTLAVNIWGREFPIGTLLINLSGAFLLGWFSSAFVFPKKLHPNLIAALTTGVIGSYTTFSTFCLETVQLIESGDYLSGMFYVGISLFGGLLLVKLGITLGDQRLKKVVNTK